MLNFVYFCSAFVTPYNDPVVDTVNFFVCGLGRDLAAIRKSRKFECSSLAITSRSQDEGPVMEVSTNKNVPKARVELKIQNKA